MLGNKTFIQIQIDTPIKSDIQELARSYNISLSQLVRLLLLKALRTGEVPPLHKQEADAHD